MVLAYVLTSNTVAERESDAAAAKAEANRLEAKAAKTGSFTNFAQIKQTRLASVTSVANSRFDWERMMRELSRVMPSGSWLQSTDASVTGQVTGSESSSSTPGAVVQPKANLVGCTPHQPDVARMMVRMRQMHRVTDVELNESATDPAAEGDVTVDSCGRYYQFDLTLTFSQAADSSEAPRGATRVPASLGGGS
jgi:Tfp pilus assembly protein PilN